MTKKTGLQKLTDMGYALDPDFKEVTTFSKETELGTVIISINSEDSTNKFYFSFNGFFGSLAINGAERNALTQYKKEQAAA
jgi:hypothetical protein